MTVELVTPAGLCLHQLWPPHEGSQDRGPCPLPQLRPEWRPWKGEGSTCPVRQTLGVRKALLT